MTNRNDKFVWNDSDVEILDKDGNPKPKTPETPAPEANTDRSDKFSWGPQDIEILNPDGTPKKK